MKFWIYFENFEIGFWILKFFEILRFDFGLMAEGEGGDCGMKNVPSPAALEFVVSASPTAATTAWLDAPAKKLARQLDFNAMMEQSKPQLQTPSLMLQKQVSGSPLPHQTLHGSVRVGWVCLKCFIVSLFLILMKSC